MNCFIFVLAFIFIQDLPFKPKEEFEIKLDYQFKQRPMGDHNTVRLGDSAKEYEDRGGGGVLPYLILNIKPLKLQEEKMRMRIATNLNERTIFKKVSVNTVLALDLGFTVDMKDRVTSHEYTLTFISADKKPVDRILISIGEDGSFLVNGEKRGQF
ncbi:MAG: hypothetical protein WD824_17400 [Cyclobacteriaceae bacterium]